jgi:centrin-1
MPPKKTKKKQAKEHGLDEAEVNEILEAFELIAGDDATMPITSVPSAMSALGIEASPEDRRAITAHLKSITSDTGNEVDFDMFLDIVAIKMQQRDQSEVVDTAFRLFDVNDTGKITLHDLRRIAKELGEDIKEEGLMDMMVEAGNLDGIGRKQFEEVMGRAGMW